jgi:hypothetical protein
MLPDGSKRSAHRVAAITATLVALLVPSSAAGQGIDQTCQFSATRLDPTTTNVLALDTNAVYWVAGYTANPETRIRIEGQFPYSRYMSWNLYDSAGRPIDSLADFELRPDKRSTNPFLPGANRFATPRDYTAFIEFRQPPRKPKPNTLYTGDSRGGTFWYRVYIPDAGRDEKGGVPLPRITLERRDGSPLPLAADACRELQAPYVQGANELIAGAPGIPDLTDDGEGYPGRNPPEWRLFVNFSQSALDILLNNESGESFYDDAQEFQNDGPGFFSSRDIAYVFTGTSRGFGEILVLRGLAPTFADTRSGAATMPSGQQLRYWSFCQYEPATQRVIDCRSDDRVAVDSTGAYTVVVSNSDQRPANARSECGVTWLPWGPQTQGLLIYRHMLADPGFQHAIQRIPQPGAEREVMADYYPSGEYLPTKEAFEARGCPAG